MSAPVNGSDDEPLAMVVEAAVCGLGGGGGSTVLGETVGGVHPV